MSIDEIEKNGEGEEEKRMFVFFLFLSRCRLFFLLLFLTLNVSSVIKTLLSITTENIKQEHPMFCFKYLNCQKRNRFLLSSHVNQHKFYANSHFQVLFLVELCRFLQLNEFEC